MVPRNVVISQGQSVTFEINGPHHLAIYAAGTTLQNIDTTNAAPPAALNCPLGAGRIDDDDANSDRLFETAGCPAPPTFGPELVQVPSATFSTPGRYLVICQLRAHFLEGMHGWVTVR
jgi:plastocyanin